MVRLILYKESGILDTNDNYFLQASRNALLFA